MPSFGGEVKPEAHVIRFYGILNITYKNEQNTSQGQIHYSLRRSFCLLLDESAGRIARELWWTNHKLSSVDVSPPWYSMLIYIYIYIYIYNLMDDH
jgi:hypothetical protein